jgi:hypothetical protein
LEGLESALLYCLVVLLSILHLDLLKFQLDDTIIKSIETAPNSELKKSKEIIQRIRRRELYKVLWLLSINASILVLFCCHLSHVLHNYTQEMFFYAILYCKLLVIEDLKLHYSMVCCKQVDTCEGVPCFIISDALLS